MDNTIISRIKALPRDHHGYLSETDIATYYIPLIQEFLENGKNYKELIHGNVSSKYIDDKIYVNYIYPIFGYPSLCSIKIYRQGFRGESFIEWLGEKRLLIIQCHEDAIYINVEAYESLPFLGLLTEDSF